MALIRLRRSGHLPQPIEFLTNLRKVDETTIAVVGYLAWDYRNDAATMRQLLGDIYGVKRLAPGFVTDAGQGFVFEHDCTTLGGNSGSVVLYAETGKAIGLHFTGEFKVRNLAVRADRIAARLSEFNIQVAIPVTYRRLCDQLRDQRSNVKLEALRNPESYADRVGFVRDFVPGVASIEPGLANLSDDLSTVGYCRADGELKYTHFRFG